MIETVETIIVVALDSLEREIIRNFLSDWKERVEVDELTDAEINHLDEAIKRLLHKVEEKY